MLFLMQKNIIVHLIIIINFNIRERHCKIQATWLLTTWIVLCSHLIDDSASPVHYNTEDLLLHLCVWLDIVFLIAPKRQQASRRLSRLLHFPKKNGCNAINENLNESWIQINASHKTKQKLEQFSSILSGPARLWPQSLGLLLLTFHTLHRHSSPTEYWDFRLTTVGRPFVSLLHLLAYY